jgi:hypothetical protein
MTKRQNLRRDAAARIVDLLKIYLLTTLYHKSKVARIVLTTAYLPAKDAIAQREA